MTLAPADRTLIESELGREPSPTEAALFENLWSEHCAYRSSRPLLGAFDTDGPGVVIGPGDDAAVVELTEDLYLTLGIESHNHPSYVDPYDGAATGVGGIVRDTLSMGAYPIALADALYFDDFASEHARYLFEGVVEGIADYGNAIGVPTVTGSVGFHPSYEGNPLVNVGCLGLLPAERLVTAAAAEPGNKLVIVGNATGRDGLGGASFASEDLSEDAATEDRPAVQVGDPYTEKLLIECNEALLETGIPEAARDLGAAGLGGATCEMVAKGGYGARIDLERLHQREPGMTATELLLAESQERMCYEVAPDDVGTVRDLAARFELGCSVVGEVTESDYVCRFEGEVVVEAPASFLADGAPTRDLERAATPVPAPDRPTVAPGEAFDTVVASPNTASKRWVYRQYDHEVGARTAVRPGHDAAVLAIREADTGVALAAGSDPNWTGRAPYEGARATALEIASDLAAVGADPIAAVDCLNGGNPERPAVYGGFADAVEGLADMCRTLAVPVVGGNVSLYNDSAAGPVVPTPTTFMIGTTPLYEPPPIGLRGEGTLVLVGTPTGRLGGSELLARHGGLDRFPAVPEAPAARCRAIRRLARAEDTLAIHTVSHGGLAVTLAEMVTDSAGLAVSLDAERPLEALFCERPGRAVVETTAPADVAAAVPDGTPVTELGRATATGELHIEVGTDAVDRSTGAIREARSTIERTFE